jgi:anti-sigma factor ChrR (cupin superfamily)
VSCSRRWSVEAARDGRLSGAEAAAVARHASGCPVCGDEARRLEALGQSLRALPAPDLDPLSVRRAKQRLLADVDAQVMARPARRWKAAVAALSLAGAGAGLALLLALRAGPDAQASGSPVLAASVEAPAPARWAQRREGKLETITLSEGTLSLRVRRASPDDRVLVLVPDGEIEDVGTVFSVEVAEGHTQRVAVTEGSVSLRRRGEPPVALRAGEAWVRPAPAALADPEGQPALERGGLAAAPGAAAAPAGAGARGASALEPRPGPSVVPGGIIPSRPGVAASIPRGTSRAPRAGSGAPPRGAPASTGEPSEFGAAFQALREGRDGEAARRLGGVADSAPDEARAEDAAYLRVLALLRAGRSDEARAAARAYLARFPRGFRRPEIEPLAR